MIKFFLSFVVIFLLVTFGITAFRSLSGAEKWAFTKTVFYGILLSAVTMLILATIVVLF